MKNNTDMAEKPCGDAMAASLSQLAKSNERVGCAGLGVVRAAEARVRRRAVVFSYPVAPRLKWSVAAPAARGATAHAAGPVFA